ncbi:hypothetical protein [Paracoccus niistensis]|uniref:Uncharacterized protein n=1 Tax=Paracoccus niistensis TaxID=632935 RepID=A0ABV6HZX2_9RHOB
MAVPLPALPAVLGQNDIVLAAGFSSGGQAAGGIGPMPDLRPPIRVLEA